jgi:hypothetical protein
MFYSDVPQVVVIELAGVAVVARAVNDPEAKFKPFGGAPQIRW